MAQHPHPSLLRKYRVGWVLLLAAAATLVLVMAGAPAESTEAGAVPTDAASALTAAQESPTGDPVNDYCLGCHGEGNLKLELPSGEALDIVVPRTVFENSIHGQIGLTCIACHREIEPYPHEPFEAETLREAKIRLYTACIQCHEREYTDTLDNEHARALAGGNTEAAICTDCHGAHEITPVNGDHTVIVRTCRQCHSGIYDLYAESVHGAALFEEDNQDVPTCTDCHGVHDVAGPSRSEFHLFSPQICADCHEDRELMDQYGISTDVFDTYVADFHGTTVILFEEIAPDQDPNTPVCIDCHGVHGILASDQADSTVYKENLLLTCQRCHPDATTDFPDSWLNHYQPDSQNAILVWLVNWFYRIIIPVVIGGMLIWVTIDGIRHLQHRRRSQASHV